MAEKKNEVAKIENTNTEVAEFNLGQFGEYKKSGEILGLEVLDQTDMKLPKIKLMQQTSVEVSKNKAKAGTFMNMVTSECYDELNCILLCLGKSRVMFKKPFKRGEAPLCRSFDAKVKTEGCGDGNCSSCRYSSWDNLPADQKKPDCNMSYMWLGYNPATKSPFRIIMSGMNVSITKDFINDIAPNRLPPFVYKVKLTTEQKENESGIFYVVKYNKVGTIDKADFPGFEDMSISMRDLFMKAIAVDTLSDDEAEHDDTSETSANGALY